MIVSNIPTSPTRFIVFEGPNGVGKSSVSLAFAEELRERGITTHLTSEPTRSPFGIALRSAEAQVSGRALALAVAADRAWHLEHEVEPALARGEWVVSDRYMPSSLVLQRLDGMTADRIWQLNEPLRIPDLTVFLSADNKTLRSRLNARATLTRFERENSDREAVLYAEAIDDIANHGWPWATVPSGGAIGQTVAAALRAVELTMER